MAATKTQAPSLAQALAALAPAANFARAFQDVHIAIEAGASIEQAVREAEQAIVAKRAELAQVESEIVDALNAAESARNAAAEAREAGKAKAGDLVAKAQARAAEIDADAQAQAQAQAAATDNALAGLAEIEGKVATAKAEHDALAAKIAKLQGQVRKLLNE